MCFVVVVVFLRNMEIEVACTQTQQKPCAGMKEEFYHNLCLLLANHLILVDAPGLEAEAFQDEVITNKEHGFSVQCQNDRFFSFLP